MKNLQSLIVEASKKIGIPDLILASEQRMSHWFIIIKPGELNTIGALWAQLVEILIDKNLVSSVIDVYQAKVKNLWFISADETLLCFSESDSVVVDRPEIPVICKPLIIAIGGASASGKTTIGKRLVRRMPDDILVYPAYTSRPQRSGAVNGVDYYLKNDLELAKMRRDPYYSDFIQARGYWYWMNRYKMLNSVITQYDKIHLFFMTQRHEFIAM